jgi:hypothetical protein
MRPKIISLAMTMMGKNYNKEDKIILRCFRDEKGGVVDFAQKADSKIKFTVKKIDMVRNNVKKEKILSNKNKPNAARLIQSWWRDIFDRFTKINDKILVIQKSFRGLTSRRKSNFIVYLKRSFEILEHTIIKMIFHELKSELLSLPRKQDFIYNKFGMRVVTSEKEEIFDSIGRRVIFRNQ